VRNVVNNDLLERAIDDVKAAVREGEDIATPLKKSGQFPPMVTHMIAVGEKTGGLEKMLNRIATSYEQRVETLVERLTSLLQPVLILAMGGMALLIVGTIFSALSGLSSLK
jgi:general secretion pathway protein F